LLDPALKAELAIEGEERLPGGSILQCYWVRIAGTERFLKLGAPRHADAFAAEADGLAALARAGARTPEALTHGVSGKKAFLLIEHLELNVAGDFAALGTMLALVHRNTHLRFGWHRDNYIGATPQANGWCDDWVEFWRERRLLPQLGLAARNGFVLDSGLLVPGLEKLIGHHPAPSLLHGDLWNGNAGFNAGAAVIFDPAVYYGDRECDLAMTELFGGFPADFYAAYREAYPLGDGYEQRKHLYNLYHLLNHLNIFGGSYLGQVQSALGLLRGLL
jgi:fructosamine-3-kinase